MQDDQLLKIKRAVADEQWNKVLNLIEPIISETANNQQLHYLFVLSLFKTKHYLEGLKYANDYYDFYANDSKSQNLYFSLLLACQDFLGAHQFLEILKQDHVDNISDYVTSLTNKEIEVRQQKVTLNQKLKKFYHLGDLSVREANSTLQEAKQLPATEYFQAAQFIFVDPFVHPLIRATVLENVVSLKLKGKIKYYWLDQQNHEIDLTRLTGILDNPVQIKLNKFLQEKLADSDPILLEGISKDKNLYLSYVYPYAKQVFKKPEEWVNYWLDDYYGRMHPDTEDTRFMTKWQGKFRKYTTELLENNDINK